MKFHDCKVHVALGERQEGRGMSVHDGPRYPRIQKAEEQGTGFTYLHITYILTSHQIYGTKDKKKEDNDLSRMAQIKQRSIWFTIYVTFVPTFSH